jgi:sodium transport system permease protein
MSERSAERRHGAIVIAFRDLLEFVRDRRTLFITLLMPLITYPVLALSSTLGVRTAIRAIEGGGSGSRLTLVYSGPDAEAWARRVDDLAAAGTGRPPGWPEQIVTLIMPTEEFARQQIDSGKADAWIDLPAGTVAAVDAAETVPLVVRLSDRRPGGPAERGFVRTILDSVADDARRRRLDRAGLPVTLCEPLAVEFRGGEAAAAPVRQVLPTMIGTVLVLLALLMATGAYYPASDALAGEKERGTIETLLIAPCTTSQLVLGKFLAVFAVTLATLAVNAVSIALTSTVILRMLPTAATAVPARAAVVCAAVTLVAYTGLAAVASALCLAVTSASKSLKEAHNTLSPVVMLVAALAGSALLPGMDANPWLPAIPFAGQVAVAKRAFVAAEAADAGVAVEVLPGLAVSLASCAVLTFLCLRLTAVMLADEEILFRGPDAPRGLARPAPRRLPTPTQAVGLALASFALLWYAQGLGGTDLGSTLVAQQALAVVAPLAAVAWWQRTDAVATYALRLPGGGLVAAAATVTGAALVGCGLFVIGAVAFVTVFGTDVSEQVRELGAQLAAMVRGTSPWVAVLLLAVMPACCEELVFRGWMLAGLAGEGCSNRRAAAAVVVQATIFALFHLLPERMPQTFVMGLALGWMTLATRSLLPAIVAHAAHNATPVLLLASRTVGEDARLVAADGAVVPAWAAAAAVGCLVAGAGIIAAAGRRSTGA